MVFSLQALDRAGNQSDPQTDPTFRIEKDETAPTLSNFTLTMTGDPDHTHLDPINRILTYGPAANGGSLNISLTIEDNGSGLLSVSFPDGYVETLNGQNGPEVVQHSDPIEGNQPTGLFSVIANDQVNNAAGETFTIVKDTVAPTVVVTVPTIIGLMFEVGWFGADAVGAQHYDVQVSPANELTWSAWLSETTALSALFLGQDNTDYTFRVRATDWVGNLSDWISSSELTPEPITKYYQHGSSRIALRRGAAVYYLHGDHLGSTSLTTDGSGTCGL